MRSLADRIRHTILFELIALIIVTIASSWIMNRPMLEMGILNIIFSGLAMGWNMLFNWLFDLWDNKYRGLAPRGVLLRIIHASLFEAVMLILGMFIVAWWLNVGLLEALLIDVVFSVFFLVYAFCYNWIYDIAFPVPAQKATI